MSLNDFLVLIALLVASITYLKSVPILKIKEKVIKEPDIRGFADYRYILLLLVNVLLAALIPFVFLAFLQKIQINFYIILWIMFGISILLVSILGYTEFLSAWKSVKKKSLKNFLKGQMNNEFTDELKEKCDKSEIPIEEKGKKDEIIARKYIYKKFTVIVDINNRISKVI